jgi:predicted RNA-binding protein YlqC (UPF0109 family)
MQHVIHNTVPTPEEMGDILGLSPKRIAAVRQIMTHVSHKRSSAKHVFFAQKKSSSRGRAMRAAAKE